MQSLGKANAFQPKLRPLTGEQNLIYLGQATVLMKLRESLLSLGQLTADRYIVQLQGGNLTIADGATGRPIIMAKRVGNLYPVTLSDFILLKDNFSSSDLGDHQVARAIGKLHQFADRLVRGLVGVEIRPERAGVTMTRQRQARKRKALSDKSRRIRAQESKWHAFLSGCNWPLETPELYLGQVITTSQKLSPHRDCPVIHETFSEIILDVIGCTVDSNIIECCAISIYKLETSVH